MNKWINAWMNNRNNEQTKVSVNDWMSKCMNQSIDEQIT